jgi:hypothetical protein
MHSARYCENAIRGGLAMSQRGTRCGTRWMPKLAGNAWRTSHRASRPQRRIGAGSTQRLFFGLLPKLDVVGSSPIARSLEVLKSPTLPVAGIRTGPGDFFLGTGCGVDFRRQQGALLGSESGQQCVEIDGRLCGIGRSLPSEPERAPELRRLRAELRPHFGSSRCSKPVRASPRNCAALRPNVRRSRACRSNARGQDPRFSV